MGSRSDCRLEEPRRQRNHKKVLLPHRRENRQGWVGIVKAGTGLSFSFSQGPWYFCVSTSPPIPCSQMTDNNARTIKPSVGARQTCGQHILHYKTLTHNILPALLKSQQEAVVHMSTHLTHTPSTSNQCEEAPKPPAFPALAQLRPDLLPAQAQPYLGCW